MNKPSDSGLIVVFRGNPIDAEIVKEMLEENGILVHMKNQLMGAIAPWHVSPGGFEPVEIIIQKKDEARAIGLINEFHKMK